MKTLLAIISTERDNELVRRHWPYFRLPQWKILGAGEESGRCKWPEPVIRLDTGVLGKRQTPIGESIFGLCQQEIDIWKWFLDHAEYDSVCVVEADNVFVRKPPEHPGNGLYLITQLPNWSPPGAFSTPMYFSTPRWADRKCAEQLYRHGTRMLADGQHEWWISDRFPAHICTKHKIPWMAQSAWSPSAGHWSSPDWKEAWVIEARAAIKMGAYCLHSCKHEWQLDAVSDLLPDILPQSRRGTETPCV